ncbi:acetylornithine aminotransferase [Prosthecobacter fusiformis]|uniref:Acetylornithine aminotransferase n=1 Tax=Prosthecobacter fusiformis TaxID=48464 RepID=A0A4R7RQH1_9BACT|nr:acetylornithine aminotransferase [Prosthecobacter fusiformis]
MDRLNDFDPAWMDQYVMPNYGRFPLWPERGEGPYLWDTDGKKYVDFAGGVAVCPLGHAHPEVADAIAAQAHKLIHVSNWYCIKGQAQLARILVEEIVRIPGKCFFSNSGAEANEGMIKLARKYGVTKPLPDGSPRYEIITFTGSFHGRTFGAMSATAQEKIHGGFGPIVPGFVYVPFNDAAALKQAITERTVAILFEPMQGESGVNPATPDFLRTVQSLCQQHDLLMLLDEVQCGLGRTGETCGWRSIIPGDEIQPDAISWAKSIGSGYPLGSFWIKDRPLGEAHPQKLCDLLGPGTHGTTYGGSPLACAAGLATLNVILRDNLPAHSATLGRKIAGEVASWKQPLITDIRAFGMMIGFELAEAALMAKTAISTSGKIASIYVAKAMLDAGLLVVPAGPKVVRWLPPMNLTDAQAAEALAIFKTVLSDLSNLS